MSSAPRKVDPEGRAYRGVMHYADIINGEDKFVYTGTYSKPGPAKAANKRLSRNFYHYRQDQYEWRVKGTNQVWAWNMRGVDRERVLIKADTRPDNELLPFVDSWVEEAVEWKRI